MADIDYLGHAPLFVGVESQYWTLQQFQNAAGRAKALGFTSLLIKVADGGIYWYSSIEGWQKVLSTVTATGIKAVPYCYCYGNAYGDLTGECTLLTTIMKACGIVIADMEVEYNGHADWAKTVSDALKPVAGLLGICTWADPLQQNWQNVRAALAPATNFWMPQVYDDYLASMYQAQYAGYRSVYPIFNLGTDVGSNNLVANVKTAFSRTDQDQIIAFWEYQALDAYAATITTILKTFGGTTVTTPTQHQLDNAAAEWAATAHLFPNNAPPSYTTGIALAWKARVCKGQHLGPPVSGEYTSVDWSGAQIKAQEFTGAHAEWNNGSCRFFNGDGEIL